MFIETLEKIKETLKLFEKNLTDETTENRTSDNIFKARIFNFFGTLHKANDACWP